MFGEKGYECLVFHAIGAGGTLGILIPPSVMLVLLGPVAGVSVMKLFAAALLPGLLLSAGPLRRQANNRLQLI